MTPTDMLLVIASIGRSMYAKWRLRQLLSGIVTVVCLVIVMSMMMGAIAIAGFYAGYLSMLHHGVEPQQAFFALMTIAVACVGGLAVMISLSVRRMGEMPRRALQKAPVTARAGEAVDAFFDGLLAK